MLSCVNIGLEIDNKEIFSNISFSLLPNSIYILKGGNGAGKTSLLKIMAGLSRNYNGNLLWNNRPINYEEYYKKCIGYLGHEDAIKLDLSVIDNLALWADLKGNHLLVPPAIGQFKLGEVINTKCKDLSKGWQKRVALARMIIGSGKLWLLDEPEANLDKEGRELLLKLLQVKISSGGMAIIASHNLDYYKKIPVININDFKHD
ncbi:MAG: heme ABC exporter ATP-binding protein CcmA [Rickettsiales bacterium]|nr:heme ABC exporter ATP-binding protein CcmA [Rickettsiales bacterium]